MKPQAINENSQLPLKFVAAAFSLAIGAIIPAAVGWTLMSTRVETAQADIAAVKAERSDTEKEWQQDRRENAAFVSKVNTKLDRIERKLDELGD